MKPIILDWIDVISGTNRKCKARTITAFESFIGLVIMLNIAEVLRNAINHSEPHLLEGKTATLVYDSITLGLMALGAMAFGANSAKRMKELITGTEGLKQQLPEGSMETTEATHLCQSAKPSLMTIAAMLAAGVIQVAGIVSALDRKYADSEYIDGKVTSIIVIVLTVLSLICKAGSYCLSKPLETELEQLRAKKENESIRKLESARGHVDDAKKTIEDQDKVIRRLLKFVSKAKPQQKPRRQGELASQAQQQPELPAGGAGRATAMPGTIERESSNTSTSSQHTAISIGARYFGAASKNLKKTHSDIQLTARTPLLSKSQRKKLPNTKSFYLKAP